MHVRWSSVRGMPVLDDETQHIAGFLLEPLLDPDTGRVLGFFVLTASGFSSSALFLSVSAICAWGTRVHVRSQEQLSPPDELLRLRKYLEDSRRILGQSVRVQETERSLGRCIDFQFSTRTFVLEWIFTKRFFFQTFSIVASGIQLVTPEVVWVCDPLRPLKIPLVLDALLPRAMIVEAPTPA